MSRDVYRQTSKQVTLSHSLSLVAGSQGFPLFCFILMKPYLTLLGTWTGGSLRFEDGEEDDEADAEVMHSMAML